MQAAYEVNLQTMTEENISLRQAIESDPRMMAELGGTNTEGKGLASAAGKQLIAKARSESRFKVIHAFPGKTNVASNKICEKLGSSKFEECDMEYQGRIIRCCNCAPFAELLYAI